MTNARAIGNAVPRAIGKAIRSNWSGGTFTPPPANPGLFLDGVLITLDEDYEDYITFSSDIYGGVYLDDILISSAEDFEGYFYF